MIKLKTVRVIVAFSSYSSDVSNNICSIQKYEFGYRCRPAQVESEDCNSNASVDRDPQCLSHSVWHSKYTSLKTLEGCVAFLAGMSSLY